MSYSLGKILAHQSSSNNKLVCFQTGNYKISQNQSQASSIDFSSHNRHKAKCKSWVRIFKYETSMTKHNYVMAFSLSINVSAVIN